MKITLVNIPDNSVYKGFERPIIRVFPLGLGYIAAVLEEEGHQVQVVDMNALDMDLADGVEAILSTEPDLVALGVTTPIVSTAIKLLGHSQIQQSDFWIVIGGPHASAMPEELLEDISSLADFVVFGEGEQTLLNIVNVIKYGPMGGPIKGAIYKNASGCVIKGLPRPLIENLDTLPFPARHLFPMSHYVDKVNFDSTNFSISGSRGCPFACIFCGSKATWGRKTRFRSPKNIILEIRDCVQNYDIRNISFSDELFTLDTNRTIDICKQLVALPYDLHIFCTSRVDTISRNALNWMKKAGVFRITFGIESGNDQILAKIKKAIDKNDVERAIRRTKVAGIEVHGSFIIGNLDDTEETIQETIDFAESLELDDAQFTIFVPLPGTESWQIAQSRGLLKKPDFNSFRFYYSVAANLSQVSDNVLIDFQREAYQRLGPSERRKAA